MDYKVIFRVESVFKLNNILFFTTSKKRTVFDNLEVPIEEGLQFCTSGDFVSKHF